MAEDGRHDGLVPAGEPAGSAEAGAFSGVLVRQVMNRAVLVCDAATTVRQAAGQMAGRRCSCIVVVDGQGHPLGIWTERDALNIDLDDPAMPDQPIARVMSAPVRTVVADEQLSTLVERFRDLHFRHAVVVDGGTVCGVVTQTDVVRHHDINQYLTLREVGTLVRRKPVSIDGAHTVAALARRLRDERVEAALVMRGETPWGMVTERDILRVIARGGGALTGFDIASHPLVTAPRSMPLVRAHDMMERHAIRHLAVTDDAGRVVAVLSFTDILNGIELDYVRFLRATLDRQEAAVRAGEQRQRLIIESTQEGYLEVDGDGRIVTVNLALERLLGRPAREMVGRSPILLCRDTSQQLYSRMVEALGEAEHWRSELTLERADGRPVPVLMSCTVLRDAQHVVTGFFAFLTDLTPIKEAERRTASLLDKVSQANAELEAFAYIISHDLQEPLRMIASYLGLVERRYGGQLDDEGREFIGFAVGGAKRLQAMITGLLEYSRIDRQERAFASCGLGGCVADAVRATQGALDAAAAQVRIDALPEVVGDRGQLTWLFQNLIANAAHFRHPDRPLRLTVSARRSGRADQWLLAVEDNGIGIDGQFHERIFQMFQRLHARGHYAGNGIGLAVCKRIVERHGGTIWVDSEPGRGSTFFFTLSEDPARAEAGA